jgi:type III pantothenate kinase
MTAGATFPLVAVDIGNSRAKFALFETPLAAGPGLPLPTPSAVIEVAATATDWKPVLALLGEHVPNEFGWRIGTVQRQVASRLLDQLRDWKAERIMLLTSRDLPLHIELPRPDMVGIDRLLGAVAANQLRSPGRPAVVVHMGTAITVNLVSSAGAFLGGAILPGISMSARAMHTFTDLLPLIDMHALEEPPPAVGTSTIPAMTSGLYWGAVGGVKELIERLGRHAGGEPDVFLTGGAAPSVASLLPNARYEPNLVTAGIAIAAATSTAET